MKLLLIITLFIAGSAIAASEPGFREPANADARAHETRITGASSPKTSAERVAGDDHLHVAMAEAHLISHRAGPTASGAVRLSDDEWVVAELIDICGGPSDGCTARVVGILQAMAALNEQLKADPELHTLGTEILYRFRALKAKTSAELLKLANSEDASTEGYDTTTLRLFGSLGEVRRLDLQALRRVDRFLAADRLLREGALSIDERRSTYEYAGHGAEYAGNAATLLAFRVSYGSSNGGTNKLTSAEQVDAHLKNYLSECPRKISADDQPRVACAHSWTP